MKIRLPIAAAVAPVGLIIGALIVGRPVSVPNDLVIDPAVVSTPAPESTPAPVTTDAPPATDTAPADTDPVRTTTTVAPVDLTARVVVANATSVSGVASTNAATLASAGFTNTRTADALPAPNTVIYVRDGFEDTGRAAADALDLPGDAVQPFPEGDITPIDAEADVLVVIGADRAGAA